jgi:hypothetical protein
MVTTSSRLSIRIVLANGGKLGPTKIALLEAIAAPRINIGSRPLVRRLLSRRLAIPRVYQ